MRAVSAAAPDARVVEIGRARIRIGYVTPQGSHDVIVADLVEVFPGEVADNRLRIAHDAAWENVAVGVDNDFLPQLSAGRVDRRQRVAPVKRGGILPGTGTPGACDGAFAQDLNARWTAKPNHNPGAGAVVQAQLWYRDPQNPSNQTTSLSDALEFCVGP